MRRKRITSLVLSVCLIVGSAVQGGAATTQEKISNAKAQQQANQSSLQQTQEKIQELESKKGESETYLADLNTQLNDLRSSLEKLQNDYDAAFSSNAVLVTTALSMISLPVWVYILG